MDMTNLGDEFAIDKQSPIPAYVQLKDILKTHLQGVGPGGRILSETALAGRFKLSRMTVRQAVQELQREGLIYKKRGNGTFVSTSANVQMLIKLDGFSAEMTKQGHTVHSKLLEAEEVRHCSETAEAYCCLQENKHKSIVRIRRLRYLDDQPFALETSYMTARIGAGLLKNRFEPKMSIYRHIEGDLGIMLSSAEHIIEPRLADGSIARLLEMKKGGPVLSLKGTTYARSGEPVEYLEGVYRGDNFRMKVTIAR